MLSHVEITARVTITRAAHFVWSGRLEYDHDCFVCRELERTVVLDHGAAHGVCTAGHPAPIRVTGWDSSGDSAGVWRLRCRLSFWWSPFPGAAELPERPAVKLNYRLGCYVCRDAEVADWCDIEASLSTFSQWPITSSCPTCGTELAIQTGPPEINLVG